MRALDRPARKDGRRSGEDARARTIEENLPLVTWVARRYASRGEPLDDLVQAGTIGLIKAVDRFDPSRGHSLSTLAVPSIEGEIRHHLRDTVPLLRAPRPLRELDGRVLAAERALSERLRRRPTAHELARELEVEESAVGEALAARAAAVPAELPAAVDDGEAHTARAEARLLLDRGWRVLDERQRRILRLSFFEDLTQDRIAQELGISQAQVSRLMRDALARLRGELAEGVAAAEAPAYSARDMAPAPVQAEDRPAYSGRLLLRMPQSLHAELAAAAEREGVSLNTLITGALASAVGWRQEGAATDAPPAEATPEPAPAPPPGSRRLLSVAVVANVAIVAVAVIIALALLVAALTQG